MSITVWNQLDDIALYQSLDRLPGETDENFFNRMKRFSKWRCKTDYLTQVHSIPIQAGLKTYPVMNITCIYPFEVTLDWEMFTIQNYPPDPSMKEYARVYINTDGPVINKILEAIYQLPSFIVELVNQRYEQIHNKFLIRDTNVKVETDFIYQQATHLEHKHLLKDSFRSSSTANCTERKPSLQDLKRAGDYFLDDEIGYLQLFNTVDDGFQVSYRRYLPRFTLEATELNLIPMSLYTKYGLTDDLIQNIPYILNGKVWGK